MAPPESEAGVSDQLKLGVESAFIPNDPNPCVRLYGYGPEGERCKTCAKLWSHRTARTYYKCELREFTRGPGSDHRVGWAACAKYERRKG
jgi:hypothetical protein